MPDFTVIEGGGPEGRDQILAEQDFKNALRAAAANMLRIIRGAGKPYELLSQMQRAINAAVKFREMHQHWPQDVITNELQIQSEDERICREEKLPQATIDRWWEDGTFDKMIAEHTIIRGALQTVASELIGQSTQKSVGESELHDGIMSWIRNREERKRRLEQAHKAERGARKNKKPKTSRKPTKL